MTQSFNPKSYPSIADAPIDAFTLFEKYCAAPTSLLDHERLALETHFAMSGTTKETLGASMPFRRLYAELRRMHALVDFAIEQAGDPDLQQVLANKLQRALRKAADTLEHA